MTSLDFAHSGKRLDNGALTANPKHQAKEPEKATYNPNSKFAKEKKNKDITSFFKKAD